MNKLYYINNCGRSEGPYMATELPAHGLTAETPVWAEGMEQWTPAGQVAELEFLFAPQPVQYVPQPVYAQAPVYRPVQTGESSNTMGLIGFVLSLLAVASSFVWPVMNVIIWVAGLVCSIVGMNKRPRGLATAGLVVSLTWLVLGLLMLLIFGAALWVAATTE